MNFYYIEIFVFIIVTILVYNYFFSREKEKQRLSSLSKKPEDKRKLTRLRNDSSVRAFIHINEKLITCWVLDRTVEGLAILVGDNEFPYDKMVTGNVINIKTTKSGNNWTEIEIRNFTKEACGWKIGCRFLQPISKEFLIDFSA